MLLNDFFVTDHNVETRKIVNICK